MNPFFNAFSGPKASGPIGGNFMQILQQFRENPAQFIMQRRFNIPQNMMDNPQAMINHLVNTGQISQEQLANAKRQIEIMQGQAQGQGQTQGQPQGQN